MRGQITIFMIIGILFLVLSGFAIYMYAKGAWIPGRISPAEQNVRSFVTNCVELVAKEGIRAIGEHGGYIDAFNSSWTKRQLRSSVSPAEGDVLQFSPGDPSGVVYWWYLASPNQCKECVLSSENIPSIDDLRNQLRKYVEENVKNCAGNFASFVREGYVIDSGNASADVQFTQKSVVVRLNWPLNVLKPGLSVSFSDFVLELPVNLQEVYSLAKDVAIDARTNDRLEAAILHGISAYSSLDTTKLPPLSAVTHGDYVVGWNSFMVGENVKNLIVATIPLIQVDKTPDVKIIKGADDVETGFYKGLLWNSTNKKYPERVKFHYLDFPIYFDISPREGQSLEPNRHRTTFPMGIAPPFQTNYYEFFYDISAPVLVEIIQDDAFNGQGYSFFFALELNIRDNKNLHEFFMGNGTVGYWDSSKNSLNAQLPQPKVAACDKLSEESYRCPLTSRVYKAIETCVSECKKSETVVRNFSAPQTLFCDKAQRLSGEYAISVRDVVSETPVKYASISYACGRYAKCVLGTTNPKGVFKGQLPICHNGLLSIERDGYDSVSGLLTAKLGVGDELKFDVEPIKNFNAVVRSVEVSVGPNNTRIFSEKAKHLTGDDELILSIERVKSSQFIQPKSNALLFEGDDKQEFELVSGDYKIYAMLTSKQGYVLPARCMMINIDGNLTFYPEENQMIQPGLLGGVLLDNNTGYWSVSAKDIDNAWRKNKTTVQFNVIRMPKPNCVSNMSCVVPNCVGSQESSGFNEWSAKKRKNVEPKFI